MTVTMEAGAQDAEEERREELALAFKCPFIGPLQELQNNTVYMTKKKTVK